MNDILDAYSVHIYWHYFDIPRMEFRLQDVRRIVDEEIAPDAQKPTYVMEFGVRGVNAFPGKPTCQPATGRTGPRSRKTNIAAFQQLWFDIASAQLATAGRSSGTPYWGRTYNSSAGNQSYWMFGPAAEGWPLFPTYSRAPAALPDDAARLAGRARCAVDEDDWKLGEPDERGEGAGRVRGSDGELTVMGLDTHGRNLNTRLRRNAAVQHRRPAAEHDVQSGALERNRGRRELGWPAPSRPTRPASPASRCRCTRRSR